MRTLVRLGCVLITACTAVACVKIEVRPVVVHFADGTNVTCTRSTFPSNALDYPVHIKCLSEQGNNTEIKWDDQVMGYEVVKR